jgi:hypothetical protein
MNIGKLVRFSVLQLSDTHVFGFTIFFAGGFCCYISLAVSCLLCAAVLRKFCWRPCGVVRVCVCVCLLSRLSRGFLFYFRRLDDYASILTVPVIANNFIPFTHTYSPILSISTTTDQGQSRNLSCAVNFAHARLSYISFEPFFL